MRSKQPKYTSDKAVRLEARLSREQKELLQHAADLLGRSLTDFVLSASREAANKVIREHEVITLTTKESENFAHALLNPPESTPALLDAVKRHNELFGESST